jgi:hypothetical protein
MTESVVVCYSQQEMVVLVELWISEQDAPPQTLEAV